MVKDSYGNEDGFDWVVEEYNNHRSRIIDRQKETSFPNLDFSIG